MKWSRKNICKILEISTGRFDRLFKGYLACSRVGQGNHRYFDYSEVLGIAATVKLAKFGIKRNKMPIQLDCICKDISMYEYVEDDVTVTVDLSDIAKRLDNEE